MPFVYAHGSPFAGTSADRNAALSAAGNTTGAPRRLHACTRASASRAPIAQNEIFLKRFLSTAEGFIPQKYE